MKSILVALLKILSYFFNPDRWKVNRRRQALRKLAELQKSLALALARNDATAISICREKLRQWRKENPEFC